MSRLVRGVRYENAADPPFLPHRTENHRVGGDCGGGGTFEGWRDTRSRKSSGGEFSVPPTASEMRPPSPPRIARLWPLALAAILAVAAWLPEAEAAKGVRRVRRKKVTTATAAPKLASSSEVQVGGVQQQQMPESGKKGEVAKEGNLAPRDGRG